MVWIRGGIAVVLPNPLAARMVVIAIVLMNSPP